MQAGAELESLHLLSSFKDIYLPDFKQVFQVAFDEGIRPFKELDRKFMQNLAFKYAGFGKISCYFIGLLKLNLAKFLVHCTSESVAVFSLLALDKNMLEDL